MHARTEGRTWTGSGLRFSGLGHYFPRTQRSHEGTVTVGGRTYGAEAAAELGVRSLHVAEEDETLEFM